MKAKSQNVPCDVLLATGSAGGTIAAVRELSSAGLRVAVISDRWLSPAAWSRGARCSYRGPLERNHQQFLSLLLQIGASNPGQVLLPTSDQTAWLYAQHAAQLSRFFVLRQPSVETMRRILDKTLLEESAIKAGIKVLPAFVPKSFDEVAARAETLDYPVLIKPRAQVGRIQNDKGTTAESASDLLERFREYTAFDASGRKEEVPLLADPLPLLQHFVKVGSEGVCSLSGYIDETGNLFVSRRCKKILQRSEPAGVGVCFESLPEDPALSDAVRRLCLELGHVGIFEVEFIRYRGGWAIIDFNPRLFNQAALDAHRGMPLGLLAYLDAAGKTSELREAVQAAQSKDQSEPVVFYDHFTLPAIMAAKILTGRASLDELRFWHQWVMRHAGHAVDFAVHRSDLMPGLVHICSEVYLGVRALPRFLRSSTPVAPVRAPMMVEGRE